MRTMSYEGKRIRTPREINRELGRNLLFAFVGVPAILAVLTFTIPFILPLLAFVAVYGGILFVLYILIRFIIRMAKEHGTQKVALVAALAAVILSVTLQVRDFKAYKKAIAPETTSYIAFNKYRKTEKREMRREKRYLRRNRKKDMDGVEKFIEITDRMMDAESRTFNYLFFPTDYYKSQIKHRQAFEEGKTENKTRI